MQNSARRLPTFGPSQRTWAIGPPIGGYETTSTIAIYYYSAVVYQSLLPLTTLTELYRKLSYCRDSRSYCVWRIYWQTIKPVSITSLLTAGTHDPIQRVWSLWTHANSIYSSVNTERDRAKFRSSRSQWITERNMSTWPVHAWLSVSKKLTFAFSSIRLSAFCG